MSIGRPITRLAGYAPALPTPFDNRGELDKRAFESFCDRQVGLGATALVVCGTTGEAPTLRPDEEAELIRIAVDVSHGRVPVIAGAGSNSTAHAIELTRSAQTAGADAVLSVVPYYNKPTQTGLAAHFRAIAQASDLPIILYDVPSRTVCGLADDTVARLAELPRVIGLKDATGDLARVVRLRGRLGGDFRLLSGDDASALGFLAQGGDGCISVTSNVAPGLCRRMFLAHRQGQIAQAQRLARFIEPLTAALFCESNPVPLKHALALLGLMLPAVRLPLVELAQASKAQVAITLASLWETCAADMVGTIVPARQARLACVS